MYGMLITILLFIYVFLWRELLDWMVCHLKWNCNFFGSVEFCKIQVFSLAGCFSYLLSFPPLMYMSTSVCHFLTFSRVLFWKVPDHSVYVAEGNKWTTIFFCLPLDFLKLFYYIFVLQMVKKCMPATLNWHSIVLIYTLTYY